MDVSAYIRKLKNDPQFMANVTSWQRNPGPARPVRGLSRRAGFPHCGNAPGPGH